MNLMRTVLITGCSSGFGKLMAEAFSRDGWRVIATLRGLATRPAEKAEIAKLGTGIEVLDLDVTLAEDRKRVAEFIAEHCGNRLDCLVNNAGYGLFGALEDVSEERVREQFEVNFFGLTFLTRALLPAIRNGRGRIINFSSLLGSQGMPLTSLYCASKFAVEGFSESLRHELAPHGVQVSVVAPGGFRTRFGANISWPALPDEASGTYSLQTLNYRRLHTQLSSGKGNAPDPVVHAVMKLANQRRMPFKVFCGKDATSLRILKAILPARLWSRLSGAMFNRMFNRPMSGELPNA